MKKTALTFLSRPALWLSLAALSALLHTPASAETHLVRMLNRNATGAMVYEPDFLRIEPGDTVKFLATRSGHDAASIDGMLPDGAQPFKGGINEEIEVSFEVPGLYGVKCLPHYAMGMVMLIQVGDGDARQMLKIPPDVPAQARRRFGEILDRHGHGTRPHFPARHPRPGMRLPSS